MNGKNIKPNTLKAGTPAPTAELEQLRSEMRDMQMDIDILKETINVLKKDRGISQTILKNQEKAVIVDALQNRYSLPCLLSRLIFPKSSYYYQKSIRCKQDKHIDIYEQVSDIFHESKDCYGYRRVHGMLKREGITVSEKVVRRIMQARNLVVKGKRNKKYNSYQGELSNSVPNVIQRNFHASKPNEKWLTDVTEFAIPAGKVYLSPIVDCFDGMLPCWNISTIPDAALVNTMLEQGISTLNEDEHPVVHSDRGCHYRWSGWIERMEKACLERSMSKKGCTPDNAACEGLFGRLKNEMFYNRNWIGVSMQEFIDRLNDYLVWYNEKRIKISLGNMSPKEYRQSLGLAA